MLKWFLTRFSSLAACWLSTATLHHSRGDTFMNITLVPNVFDQTYTTLQTAHEIFQVYWTITPSNPLLHRQIIFAAVLHSYLTLQLPFMTNTAQSITLHWCLTFFTMFTDIVGGQNLHTSIIDPQLIQNEG